MKHYREYIWKDGIPYGIQPVEENFSISGKSYKVIADPYRKWISLEEYVDGHYDRTTYDSSLLDFRKLKPAMQHAWQKCTVKESPEEILSIIRDQNDRVIFFELYLFEKGRCRSCKVSSPWGQTLSFQKILYIDLGDEFNGVILYDSNQRPVMRKKYNVDPESGEFTELIEENWQLRN